MKLEHIWARFCEAMKVAAGRTLSSVQRLSAITSLSRDIESQAVRAGSTFDCRAAVVSRRANDVRAATVSAALAKRARSS